MDAIYDPNEKFDFEKMLLTPPASTTNGNHFIKFIINDNPLYIQTPKCKIKPGMIKTTKKVCCDLMFTIENEEFIQWIENLENYCQKYIYTKRDKWFETNLEKDEIENSFTSALKLFKSGKYYTLRVNVPSVLGKINMKVYDENENIIEIENIAEDGNVISILEMQGIKCSPRGFQIEMEMKQLLVLKKENLFDKCILIKKTIPTSFISVEKDMSEPIEKNEIITNNDTNLEMNIDTTQINEYDEKNQTNESILEEIPHDNLELKPEEETIEFYTKKDDTTDLFEVDFNLEKIPQEDTLTIKKRNDVFYEMYKEAMKKAKMAKDLAVSSYLEAKRIKNTHMLEEISDDSDFDEESLNFSEDE
jgi:hypothetical protein